MTREKKHIVVVGGGPAGLSAATEAARYGMGVTLVDESSTLGGQYFRGRQDSDEDGSPLFFEHQRHGHDVQALLDTVVFDAPGDGALSVATEGQGTTTLPYDALVLAMGAYDRTVALPGWTLPGVFTAGGASTLARSYDVTPGRRVLVAGAGPFLLPVADELALKGCRVQVIEATTPATMITGIPFVATDLEILSQTMGYVARLAARRVRRMYGRMITSIHGHDRVEAVTIHRVDDRWRPISGSEITVDADAVCLGFGFVPHLDLAQLLGCGISYSAEAAEFCVKTDDSMRTSLPHIYAAGEITGVGGFRVAVAEGGLAGLTAAYDAGVVSQGTFSARANRLNKRLAHVRRMANWIRSAYRPRVGLWALAKSSTIVCRCEDVTLGTIQEELATNAATPRAVKTATRPGMGLCQGRICSAYIMEWLQAQHSYQIPLDNWPWRVRPPIRPVRLDDWLLNEES
jgi:NADPH-dependent 2,4-dienoyl-CoA reductase/sulfur reductase-like enzyme